MMTKATGGPPPKQRASEISKAFVADPKGYYESYTSNMPQVIEDYRLFNDYKRFLEVASRLGGSVGSQGNAYSGRDATKRGVGKMGTAATKEELNRARHISDLYFYMLNRDRMGYGNPQQAAPSEAKTFRGGGYAPIPKYQEGGGVDPAAWASMAGLGTSVIDTIDSSDGQPSRWGTVAKGALSGAGAGAALGPWGAIGGAVIGGVGGLLGFNAAEKEKARMEQEAAEQRAELQKEMFTDFSRQGLSTIGTTGVKLSSYYAHGGIPPYLQKGAYNVEDDEVIEHKQKPVLALGGGSIKALSSDLSVVDGAKHKDGGVDVAGGERIYSDQLRIPKELEKRFVA